MRPASMRSTVAYPPVILLQHSPKGLGQRKSRSESMDNELEFSPAARPLLRPGETCWRIEKADRVALLVDGAAYFSAAKAALLNARKSILLLGWDFDPRTRLSPDVDDPRRADTIGALLLRLRRERDLDISLLICDMTLPFAARHDFYQQRTAFLIRQMGIVLILDRFS